MDESPAPALVIVHEDPRALLLLRRELVSPARRVLTARSADELFVRLSSLIAQPGALVGVLLSWQLSDYAALEIVCQLREVPDAPLVVAFADGWRSADLRRALQLGVAGVLTAPLEAATVAAELADPERGECRSRRGLIKRAGPSLLAPDESLWQLEASPEWCARMRALASALRAERRRQVASEEVGWVVAELARGLDEPKLDLDRLRGLVDAASMGLVAIDQARLAALLPQDEVPQVLDEATRERLRRLGEGVTEAVDHVRLLQLREEFGPIMELVPELDFGALRALLPHAPPELEALPPEVLLRLRMLAVILSMVADPSLSGEVLERFRATWGLPEPEVAALDALCAVLEGKRERATTDTEPAEIDRLIEAGAFDRALSLTLALRDSVSAKPRLLNNLGMKLRGNNRPADAARAYRKALRLKPGTPALLFNLAVVLAATGQDPEALRLCEEALEHAPEMENARRLASEIRVRLQPAG